MNDNQRYAIEQHKGDLVDCLKLSIPLLLSYAQVKNVINFAERSLIEANLLNADKVLHLLKSLMSKELGYDTIMDFLEKHGMSILSVKIATTTAGGRPKRTPSTGARSVLTEFSTLLAHYYQHHYANLQTIWQTPRHVKDVWVPLQIEGQKEPFLRPGRIDHAELLDQTYYNVSNVALVKGDPGTGKTTLVKKIAYDWAINVGSADNHFSLVLAVPLRSVGKAYRFDHLAIDYFHFLLGIGEDIPRADLNSLIKQLGYRVLIVLDGLDEYEHYVNSPFKKLFAAPFQKSPTDCKLPPPHIPFKLLVTSRPYACEQINQDFYPLRFQVCPLDSANLEDFVSRYCMTETAGKRVSNYLQANSQLVIKNPLILTFICYLAESNEDIPTNLTSLYQSLINQMVRRAVRKGLLSATGHSSDSTVLPINSTSQLAFVGGTSSPPAYEFDIIDMQDSQVTNSSFICGFLLHKFDLSNDRLKAEFPHRSIQEFFAATYAQGRICISVGSERDMVVKAILSEDSQFGRFFFGLCSRATQFLEMTNWLHLSFADVSTLSFIDVSSLIQWTNSALADCSADNKTLCGKTLYQTVGQIKSHIVSNWDRRWYIVDLRNLNPNFESGLGMNRIKPRIKTDGKISFWSLSCTPESASAELVVLRMKSPKQLLRRFIHIEVLMWECFGSLTANLSSQLAVLPPLSTLLIWSGSEISVTIFIRFSAESHPLDLTTFRFQYDAAIGNALLDQFNISDTSILTVDDVTQTVADTFTYRCVNVTVCRPIQQATLIGSLIKVAVSHMDEIDPYSFVVVSASETLIAQDVMPTRLAKRRFWRRFCRFLCFCRKVGHQESVTTPLLQ